MKKFLSNGRICLYSSQPNVGSHIRPSLPPAPPPPDIELADALLLLLLLLPLGLSFKEMLWSSPRFNKIPSWMSSRHHPQCIGLLYRKIAIILYRMIQIFLFSSKCVLGLLSEDTRRESDDTARNIFLLFLISRQLSKSPITPVSHLQLPSQVKVKLSSFPNGALQNQGER